MTTFSLSQIKSLVDKKITELKFPDRPAGLYSPIRYTLEGAGKRLRPVLLLSTVQAFGGNPEDFLSQAVALEIFHNSTLIHDDVMDNSDMRHGRLTVHKKWDSTTAILSGDAMISLSNILMAENLPREIASETIRIFNDIQLQVDQGQQFDMDFEKSDKISLEEYKEMILGKTGALFACATGLGVLFARKKNDENFNNTFRDALTLGYLIGEIFQLQDDLLDTYGDENTFGKPVGQDILNNKKTWLSISLLHSKERKKALQLMESDIEPSEKIRRTISLYDSFNLKEKLQKEIDTKIDKAIDLIMKLTSGVSEEARDAIVNFIHSIARREK